MYQLGMFAAKWAAKRFDPDASETDPGSWNWSSYLKGSVGAVLGGMVANMLKPGSGQKALEGGLNLMIYKAIQNELISGSDWAAGQLGEDDEDYDEGYFLGEDDDYVPDEYLLTGTDEYPLMFGEDGELYPADDIHRLPEVEMDGYGQLEPVGPLGQLEPVGPLGADPYSRAYNL